MQEQITQNNQPVVNNLTETVKDLNHSLQAIQPDNSKTTQLITYLLLGTAITGIFVYHYIREQEKLC
jgi:hypothetical protein